MNRTVLLSAVVLVAPGGIGCGTLHQSTQIAAAVMPDDDDKKPGIGKKDDDDAKKKEEGPPKTLFKWEIGPEVAEKPPKPEKIQTDRPDFTEASTTVGRGHVQLETGYVYTQNHVEDRL